MNKEQGNLKKRSKRVSRNKNIINKSKMCQFYYRLDMAGKRIGELKDEIEETVQSAALSVRTGKYNREAKKHGV